MSHAEHHADQPSTNIGQEIGEAVLLAARVKRRVIVAVQAVQRTVAVVAREVPEDALWTESL